MGWDRGGLLTYQKKKTFTNDQIVCYAAPGKCIRIVIVSVVIVVVFVVACDVGCERARTKFEMCAACAESEVESNGLSLGDTRVA